MHHELIEFYAGINISQLQPNDPPIQRELQKPVVTQSWNWFKANPQRTEILTHLWASIFHNTWRLLNFPKTTYIYDENDEK